MALPAGCLTVTVQFAQGLKDAQWIGRQSPYAVLRCGAQVFRTKTASHAGRNPVWNETFQFELINENTLNIEVKDHETLERDPHLGTAIVDLARVRERGSQMVQAPVICPHSRREHGFVSVALEFRPNAALGRQQQQQQQQQWAPAAAAALAAAPPQVAYASAQPAAVQYVQSQQVQQQQQPVYPSAPPMPQREVIYQQQVGTTCFQPSPNPQREVIYQQQVGTTCFQPSPNPQREVIYQQQTGTTYFLPAPMPMQREVIIQQQPVYVQAPPQREVVEVVCEGHHHHHRHHHHHNGFGEAMLGLGVAGLAAGVIAADVMGAGMMGPPIYNIW